MTQEELNDFNGLLNTFNDISFREIDNIWENFLLKHLPQSLSIFTHLITFYNFTKLERITINKRILGSNKRIKNISQLKYPPAEYVNKYGRCNLKQKSVFYCAPSVMTALSEMRPNEGDLITKSIWKIREEHDFKVCPIFHFQPTNGTFNPRTQELEEDFYEEVSKIESENLRKATINLSKFIAYHFSKQVDSENDRNYLFSAIFADKILNELDNGSIEAIVYPSVKQRLSFENVALKPEILDKYFYLAEVHEMVVFQDLAFNSGGYGMRGTCDCKEFNFANNEILWPKENMIDSTELEFLKKKFQLDLS